MFRERNESGDGYLQRLDARVKVVLTLSLILGILLTPERASPAYPLLWALTASLAAASSINVWRLARRGGLALPFVMASAALPFTMPGQPVFEVAGLAVTDAGLLRFMSILVKSWLSVQAALLLSMTTPFTELLRAFHSLRVPETLIAIVGFMYRYLDTLSDEARRLLRARSARSAAIRGRKLGGSLIWRARTAGGMVGSLFLRSYERSERIYAAMLSRGYDGRARALSSPPLRPTALAYGLIPFLALCLIELLALLWWAK